MMKIKNLIKECKCRDLQKYVLFINQLLGKEKGKIK